MRCITVKRPSTPQDQNAYRHDHADHLPKRQLKSNGRVTFHIPPGEKEKENTLDPQPASQPGISMNPGPIPGDPGQKGEDDEQDSPVARVIPLITLSLIHISEPTRTRHDLVCRL